MTHLPSPADQAADLRDYVARIAALEEDVARLDLEGRKEEAAAARGMIAGYCHLLLAGTTQI